MTSSWRSFLSPLVALVIIGCGSSNADFSSEDDSGAPPSDTASGGDTNNGGDTSTTKDTAGGGDGTPTDTAGGGDTTTTPDTAPTDGSTCPGTDCGGTCVDTNSDPKNCGGCGKAVCHMEICKGGAPTCYPGFKACGATGCLGCRDINSDPENCGDCGTRCSTGQTCTGGKCMFVTGGCGGGLTKCGGVGTPSAPYCTDTDRDPANCGGCGKVCAPTELCIGGSCETYTGAPGCSTCPCAACTDPTANCCTIDGFGGPRCVAGDCP